MVVFAIGEPRLQCKLKRRCSITTFPPSQFVSDGYMPCITLIPAKCAGATPPASWDESGGDLRVSLFT